MLESLVFLLLSHAIISFYVTLIFVYKFPKRQCDIVTLSIGYELATILLNRTAMPLQLARSITHHYNH